LKIDSNFKIKVRSIEDVFDSAALYDHLLTQLDWQDASPTRQEAFLGYTIGSDAHPSSVEYPLCPVAFQVNDKGPYVIGADGKGRRLGGITLDRKWGQLEDDSVEGAKLLKAVRSWILKLTRDDAEPISHLQCNVNLYSADDVMSLHRDDCDEYLSTFAPAAITSLLYANTMSEVDRAQAAFVLFGKPRSKRPLTLHRNNFTSDKKYVDECNKHRIDHRCGAGELYALSGSGYRLGLHTAQTGWRQQRTLGFERMSLNFRIVRERAWRALIARKAIGPLCETMRSPIQSVEVSTSL
jgi:hypothetical protein